MDIEDLEQLMQARHKSYRAMTRNYTDGIDEMVKLRAHVKEICSGRYIDPMKLIFVVIKH